MFGTQRYSEVKNHSGISTENLSEQDETDVDLLDEHHHRCSGSHKATIFSKSHRKLLAIHGIFTIFNLLIIIIGILYISPYFETRVRRTGPNFVYTPARDAIAYEARTFNSSLFSKNIYKGEPRPEQAHAWKELVAPQNVLLTAEELHKLNRTSIEILGQGYLATLNVFHQLHCLDYIRKYIYSDYYHINEDKHTIRQHISHCIDSLRENLQCHGDTSILTYSWRPDYLNPWPDFQIEHECRNFDKIVEWARKRKPNITTENFINPVFDPSRYDESNVPAAYDNATELVGGTRLNPKVLKLAGAGAY